MLGLFKVKLELLAQINSETGEIISLEKHWWNFLVIKLKEPNLTLLKNQTNLTGIPVNFTNITLPSPINQTIPGNITTNQTNTITCTDSDGGKNYTMKGNTVSISSNGVPGNANDYCSGNYVIEYFCMPVVGGNSVVGGETYNCPNGCSNGACI